MSTGLGESNISQTLSNVLSGDVDLLSLSNPQRASLISTKRIPGSLFGIYRQLCPDKITRTRGQLQALMSHFLSIEYSGTHLSTFEDFPIMSTEVVKFVNSLPYVPDFILEALAYNLPPEKVTVTNEKRASVRHTTTSASIPIVIDSSSEASTDEPRETGEYPFYLVQRPLILLLLASDPESVDSMPPLKKRKPSTPSAKPPGRMGARKSIITVAPPPPKNPKKTATRKSDRIRGRGRVRSDNAKNSRPHVSEEERGLSKSSIPVPIIVFCLTVDSSRAWPY